MATIMGDAAVGGQGLHPLRLPTALMGAWLGGSRRHLLVLRFGLTNGALAALMVAAWKLGWLDTMLASDRFHVIKLIVVVFALGLWQVGGRVLQLGRELDGLAAGRPAAGRASGYLRAIAGAEPGGRALLAQALHLKLATRLAHVRWLAGLLVFLGLLGTIIGFIVALSSIDPQTVADPASIGPMVSNLLLGMSMALYKTLAGSVLNIWLMLNYRLLEHGTVHLYTQAVELGERV